MTKQEINRKINQLKGYRVAWHDADDDYNAGFRLYTFAPENDEFVCCQDSEESAWAFAPGWDSDVNWPILLRELPAPELFQYAHSKDWGCNGARGSSPAEAVCLAWLKWKDPSGKITGQKKGDQ